VIGRIPGYLDELALYVLHDDEKGANIDWASWPFMCETQAQ